MALRTATIRLPNKGPLAVFDGGRWRCPVRWLEQELNEFYSTEMFDLIVHPAYEPNIIASVATWAAKAIGATVVTLPKTEYVAGRIY